MSRRYDSMQTVRLLPETARKLSRWRKQNPLAPSTTKLVNYFVLLGLEHGLNERKKP